MRYLICYLLFVLLLFFSSKNINAGCTGSGCGGGDPCDGACLPSEYCNMVVESGCGNNGNDICNTYWECVGGGGGGECHYGTVNCSSGGTVSLHQKISTQCENAYSTAGWCSAPGDAQRITGCCGQEQCDSNGENCTCGNPEITTYECCDEGYYEKATTMTGNDYSWIHSCFDNVRRCEDDNPDGSGGNDTYVSHTSAPATIDNRCYKDTDPDSSSYGEWFYNTETTCTRKTTTYSCVSDCTAGTKPTLTSPANGAISSGPSGSASITFDWDAPSSWGTEASGTNRSYTLCIGTNSSNPCNGGSTYSVGSGSTPTSTSTKSVNVGTSYWGVKAKNKCGLSSVLSNVRSVCVEGYVLPGDAGVGNSYFSQWGSCNPNTHKRTRTCSEDCGTDNCTAAAAAGLLEEDCQGEIRGTIFDASDVVSCPSFDPNTGYLIGVDTDLSANNREFVVYDQSTTPTHPWEPITTTETDSSGNYSVRVYAPTTYSYDFSNLKDIYIVSEGPKLTCTSLAAVVADNSTSCGTQPCTTVNNMSFGFNRYWSGWWQVQGAGVHAEDGLKSSIPSALVSEQSLILPEPTTGNRRGIATYGIEIDQMLGLNPNAKISGSLWKSLSNYEGEIYDYAYFNQQFKKYVSTVWDGVTPIVYDDGGRGYEILKVSGNLSNFDYSPNGTEKVIILVDGDVTINSNITVPNGAFLAVIAKGNIEFGTLVTNADGWYLSERIYIRCIDGDGDSECDRIDNQFVGNGSFVSWKGTFMNREREAANNAVAPAEKFNYRKDLYDNAPDPMRILSRKYRPYVP